MQDKLKKIKILNSTLSYYIKDNKAKWTAIFVHGFNSSTDFAKPIYELDNNYNIIALNLPGSKYLNELDQELGIDYFSDLIMIFIDKCLRSKKIVLIGHSLGGGIVAKISDHRRVKRVFYISTINPEMIKSKGWMALYDFFYPSGMKKNLKKMAIKTGSSLYKTWTNKTSPIMEFIDEKGKFLPVIKNYLLNNIYMESVLRNDYEKSLVKNPLFIIGDSDKIVETLSFVKFVEKDLKQQVLVMQDTKHNPFDNNSVTLNYLFNNEIPLTRRFFKLKLIKRHVVDK